MKSIYLHVFYLTIIAFLGYNYWSSVQAFKAFGHLNKQLTMDYTVMDYNAELTYRKIDRNCMAYGAYMKNYYGQTVTVVKIADSVAASINDYKVEFIKLNGGLDTANMPDLVNGSSTKTSKTFFTDVKISEIKDELSRLSKVLMDSIQDKKDRDIILKQYALPLLIINNAFWESLKTLPASGAFAQLAMIQNKIKTDEFAFLNYQLMRTSVEDMRFDTFKTAIAPQKAALIEGETFEADIYLAAFSSNANNNITIKVDGQIVGMNHGVAHFKGKKEAVGTKTFKAVATIKNPLTGQVTTSEGSFEYQVLPKCSRDCQ
jgi:GldM N-terminal domain